MIKNIFLSTLCTTALFNIGCSSLLPAQQSQNLYALPDTPYIISEPGNNTSQQQIAPDSMSYPVSGRLYASHKLLDDYVAELAMKLYQSSTTPITDSRVAVAGFAELSPARDTLHPLGNALAERFLQQMPRYGVIMVDHKLTGRLQLTAAGDQVFSNRAGQVTANQPIDYILSGTVQHSYRGAQVNVRIMHLKNKTVLASASQLIPQFVLDTAQVGL